MTTTTMILLMILCILLGMIFGFILGVITMVEIAMKYSKRDKDGNSGK